MSLLDRLYEQWCALAYRDGSEAMRVRTENPPASGDLRRLDDQEPLSPPMPFLWCYYGDALPIAVRLGDLKPTLLVSLVDHAGTAVPSEPPKLYRDDDAPLYGVFREPYFEWRLPAGVPTGYYRAEFTITYADKGEERVERHTFHMVVMPNSDSP